MKNIFVLLICITVSLFAISSYAQEGSEKLAVVSDTINVETLTDEVVQVEEIQAPVNKNQSIVKSSLSFTFICRK